MHISLSAETVTTLAGIPVSNSTLASFILTLALILLALFVYSSVGSKNKAYFVVESVIEAALNFFTSIVGPQKAKRFFPLVFTLMIFILLNNWIGLIPGVGSIGLWKSAAASSGGETAEGVGKVWMPLLRAATADLNLTIALALFSVVAIQFYGLRSLGLGYLKKFFNFESPVKFAIGLLELVSEISKILSFSFRLFGNVFAGEVLITVILGLLPIVIPLPFYGLEIFVGFIQALVFSMLTLVFLDVATTAHGSEAHERG